MNSTVTIPSVYPVACHTDHVGPGSTFVAIKGMKDDGIEHIQKALSLGANRIVVEKQVVLSQSIINALEAYNAELLLVENTRKQLALLSAQALGYPAQKLRIIAITGTKGKSTTAFLLEHLLKQAGYKTALLSTVKNRILAQEFATHLTTAQPDYLHVFFNTCLQAQVEYVVMEVAAQAVSLYRVAGLTFEALIFTNFSLEHSEFYQSVDDYFAAKADLLTYIKPGAPVILNADDQRVAALAVTEVIKNSPVITFSLHNRHNIHTVNAFIQKANLSGIKALIKTEDQECIVEAPTLVGSFNMYNILATIAFAQTLKIKNNIIEQAFLTFSTIPGRLQRFVLSNGSTAFIDYAHNPASFEAILSALRPLSSHIIVVFGAGGDRDVTKRPLMGAIASAIADVVILTTDNPRSEDPKLITQDILQGISSEKQSKILVELDRQKAIFKAYELSHSDSMIVLLGKGPDEYQHIQNVKIPFSEAAILRSL